MLVVGTRVDVGGTVELVVGIVLEVVGNEVVDDVVGGMLDVVVGVRVGSRLVVVTLELAGGKSPVNGVPKDGAGQLDGTEDYIE